MISADGASRAGSPPDPRFSFANERTFLAWNRTGLALIGGGVLAGDLVKDLPFGAGLTLALPPIVLGAALAVAGFRRWRVRELQLRRREPLVRAGSASGLLAAATAALAALAITLTAWSELAR